MKVINVVGARPNFMKIAPLMRVMRDTKGIEPELVHTGQHYDHRMSQLFFEELGIPRPDLDLEILSLAPEGDHSLDIEPCAVALGRSPGRREGEYEGAPVLYSGTARRLEALAFRAARPNWLPRAQAADAPSMDIPPLPFSPVGFSAEIERVCAEESLLKLPMFMPNPLNAMCRLLRIKG